MSNTTIIKTCFFSAPRETVWSFLTEKDKLAQWFHPATADLAMGEDYALVRENDKGENPGDNYVRIALVENADKTQDALNRIKECLSE